MAIKIIDKRPAKPIYQGECDRCGCLFEFEHCDANEHLDSQIDGFHYNVTCPGCKKRVWVKKKLLRYE